MPLCLISRHFIFALILACTFINTTWAHPTSNALAPDNVERLRFTKMLPHKNASSYTLYRILVAEAYFENNDWKKAYRIYMKLGNKINDPRLFQRATTIAMDYGNITSALRANKKWAKWFRAKKGIDWYANKAHKSLLRLLMIAKKYDDAKPLFVKLLKETSFTPKQDQLPPWLDIIINDWRFSKENDKKSYQLLESLFFPKYKRFFALRLALARYRLSIDKTQTKTVASLVDDFPKQAMALQMALTYLPLSESINRNSVAFLRLHPKNTHLRIALAQKLIEDNRYQEAYQHYSKILALNTNDNRTLRLVAFLAIKIGKYKNAVELLTTVLKHTAPAKQIKIRISLAKAYRHLEQPRNIIKILAPIANTLENINALMLRSYALAKLDKKQQAYDTLAKLPTSNEDEAKQKFIRLSQFLHDTLDYKKSFSVIQEAADKYPQNIDIIYQLAIASDLTDNFPIAEKALHKVIALAPQSFMGYNGLGYLLANRNIRLKEAETLLQKALSISADNPMVLDSWGWLLFRQGKVRDAIKILQEVYQKLPVTEVGLHMAEALWADKQHAKALKLLKTLKKDTVMPNEQHEIKVFLKRLDIVLEN